MLSKLYRYLVTTNAVYGPDSVFPAGSVVLDFYFFFPIFILFLIVVPKKESGLFLKPTGQNLNSNFNHSCSRGRSGGSLTALQHLWRTTG